MVTISLPPELKKIEQILFASIKQNRLDLVNKIIQDRKCDVNVRDNFDRTPLHLASSSGNLAMVKVLILGRAIVDPIDKFGITPLFWAVYNNHKHVAVYLIESGAKHNRVTKQGFTIIHFIAESNAVSILRYLYRKFQILNYDVADNNGVTPFLISASKGNDLMMEILIKQKCNILAKDMHGRNALHLASKNGHIDSLAHLLSLTELKDIIDDLDEMGNSALHLACENNQQDCVRLLLESGANPNIETSSHDCPLIECSRRGFHKCIDLLIENNADKGKKTKAGDTVLHEAALGNLTDTIYFLFSRKFDVTATNEHQQTPLHYAVSQNRLEAVEALLFCGAPLDVKDKDGHTPLMVAARANYTVLVDMIIRADRWRKTYPADAKKFLDEIVQIQENRCVTPSLQSRKRRSKSRKHVEISSRSQTEELTDNDDSDSGTFVAQKTSPSSETISFEQDDTRSQNAYALPRQNPQIYSPNTSVYSQNNSVHNDDLFMSEFIDPFKQFTEEFNGHNNKHGRMIIDHRSRSTASSESGSELSLGYEASRVWNQANTRHINEPSNGLRSPLRSSSLNHNHNYSETDLSEQYNHSNNNNNGISKDRIHTSLTNLSNRIQGDEIHLPNGETLFRVNNAQVIQSNKNMRLTSGFGLNSTNPFTLRAPCQHYAEDMNILFFEYSHRHAKPWDWKHLAEFWAFTSDDVKAIGYQNIGKNSYKEHTFRLLNIWLHGVGDNQSPLNELYLALTTIGRKRTAEQLRKRVNALSKVNAKNKCIVS
ncbi:unnamed protein product [Heterobilharzia americana]|nr:unnamed protein product [Heterobilharzia americana]